MFRKLQVKFVAICMVLVSLVLGGVFFAVHSSAQRSVETTSRDVLQRVIDQDTGVLFRPTPGEAHLPYFTVSVWPELSGKYSAYITGGTYTDLENTEELAAILQDCLSQKQTEGIVAQYHLRYLRQDTGLYIRLAFVDMAAEAATLHHMTRGYLQIAAVAFLVLLGMSILLSRWATAPVARAWDQQRQFLSDASHELKTPLTVILSNADLLSRSPMEERPARWVDNIQSEAGQMQRLVEEMLTLARADHTQEHPILTELSLSDLATDCVLSFEPVAFESGRVLTDRIQPEIRVLGDRDRLRQAVSVLLDNAVKYGAPGGEITLTLTADDRRALLTVSNPGDPIPPQQLKHLFQRFYRGDASRGEQSGFGLGLPIAAAIAQQHGGTLKAESDARSTRFLLSLPLKR